MEESHVESGLEQAIALYNQALKQLQPGTTQYANCLMNIAIVHLRLADKRCDARVNIEQALTRLREAAQIFPPQSTALGQCFEKMAAAYSDLAEKGVDELANNEAAAEYYARAGECYPPDSEKRGHCLGNQALAHQAVADLGGDSVAQIAESIRLHRRARSLFVPGSEDVAASLMSEGNARERLASFGQTPAENAREAIRLFEEAFALIPAKSENAAKCLLNQSNAHQTLADLGVEAKENLDTKLALLAEARSMLSSRSRVYADCLYNETLGHARLADLGYDVKGNLERIITLSLEARQIFPPDTQSYGLCLTAEASARKELASFGLAPAESAAEAVRLHQQSRAVFTPGGRAFTLGLINEAMARSTLAYLGVEPRANLEESIRLFEQAREGGGAGFAASARSMLYEASSRASLADLGVNTDWNLERAVALYEQAREGLPPESVDMGLSFMYEGNIRFSLSELNLDAQANAEAAARLYHGARASFGAESLDFARCLMLEANALSRLADFSDDPRADVDESLRLYEEAQRLFLRESGGTLAQSNDLATCVSNQGSAFSKLADLGVDPEANVRLSIEKFREGGGLTNPESSSYSNTLSNVGAALSRLATLGIDAEANRREALNIFRSVGQLNERLGAHRDAVMAYHNMSLVAEALEDQQTVKVALVSAVAALERVRSGTTLAKDRGEWMERHEGIFRRVVEACLRTGDKAGAAEYAEQARSRALLDLLHGRDFAPENVPPDRWAAYLKLRRDVELLEMAQSATTLPLAGDAGGEHSAQRAGEKARLVEDLGKLEDEIRRLDPDYFALARPPSLAEMGETARRLNRTLVSFWSGDEGSAVFIVRPDGEFECLERPGVNMPRIFEWMIGPPAARGTTGWISTYFRYQQGEATLDDLMEEIDRTVETIYSELLEPLRDRLLGWKETRVVLIAGGLLGMLPLHAAKWQEADGATRFLIDELDIVYAPSVWILGRCLARERSAPLSALIVGTSGAGAPLLFTRWEVRRVAELVTAAAGVGASTSLPDAAATPAAVIKALPRHTLCHLSCHGSWNFREPLNSALQLEGGGLTLARLLSEVRLDRARLVVLSACESGVSHKLDRISEEFVGLPAGFIFAGAPSVVGTLWPVLDPPTALLMIRFYENLLAGDDVSASLRAAQLWMKNLTRDEAKGLLLQASQMLEEPQRGRALRRLEAWAETFGPRPFERPYYWAAFQAMGAPAPIFAASN